MSVATTIRVSVQMKILSCAVFSLCIAATSAFAGAKEDANTIATLSVTEELFESALAVQRPSIVALINQQFSQRNIVVSDTDAFAGIIFEEMLSGFTEGMRDASKTYFLQNFSAAELAAIAEFYKSDAGAALLAKTPDLTQYGAQQGALIGQQVVAGLMPRVAKRMKDQGIAIEAGSLDSILK